VRGAFALLLAAWASLPALAAPPSLLAVDRDGDALLVIDPATLATRHRVAVGESPHEVAGSPDGTLAVVANYGNQAEVGASLSLVDLATGKEERIDVRPFLRPHGLALREGKLYFTSEATRSVARLDLATRRVDWTMGLGQSIDHMLALSGDGARLYTANMLSDSVTRVDIGGPPHLPLLHAQVGSKPEGLALSPDGRTLWVGLNGEGRIVVLDALTLAEIARIDAGSQPARIRFTPDGRLAFVVDPQRSALLVFDATTRAQRRSVPIEGVPLGMWPSSDWRHLYLTLAGSGEIARLDLATFEVATRASVGQVADGIGWAGAD
jgi:YVTN family beta-propeller protein